jgi:hypothetical protein
VAACGYQFHVEGAGPTIGGVPEPRAEGPRLRILPFENLSFEPNLEGRYTTYVQREFAQVSGAQVVGESESADLILRGRINSVSLPTINFSLKGTFEGRVTVSVSATVEEAKTGRKVWTQSSVASSEFFMTNDLQLNRVLQTRALEQAGRLIAADLAMRFQQFLHLRHTATSSSPAALVPTTSTGDPKSPAGP